MAERDGDFEKIYVGDFADKTPISDGLSVLDIDYSRVVSGYNMPLPLLDMFAVGVRPGRFVLDERDGGEDGGTVYATAREQFVIYPLAMPHQKDLNGDMVFAAPAWRIESIDLDAGPAADAFASVGIDPRSLYTVTGWRWDGVRFADIAQSLVFEVFSNSLDEADSRQLDEKKGAPPQRKKHARKSEYTRKSGGNVTSAGLLAMTGPLTNALMGRHEGSISPEQYFTKDSVRVNTGSGGYVMLDVRAGDETEIDAAYREYRLNDRDRFWLDPLYTLAIKNGRRTIEGSEILKLRGYANPYAESSATTMADALKSISKAISTRVAIDVSGEKRNRRKGNAKLVSSIRLQPVVNATVDLDRYEDEDGAVKDFTINLQTSEPIESLPLAKYEMARKMLTTVSADDFDFKSVKKLTTDDRQMWSYVLRTIKSEQLSGTILFETMWRNLELQEPDVSPYAYVRDGIPLDKPSTAGGVPVAPEDAPRADEALIQRRIAKAEGNRRRRMLKKLEKMLNDKQADLFKRWDWHKDGAGRVDGVTITRKKN